MPKNSSYEERFFEKVIKTQTCWVWNAALNSRGYGSFTYNKKRISAHKFSYLHFVGGISDGLYVCHSCDNIWCVNPEHLWLWTPKENMQDMINKGRGAFQKEIVDKQYEKMSHCRRGHEFDVVGCRYGVKKDGRKYRTCKECQKISQKEYKNRIRKK